MNLINYVLIIVGELRRYARDTFAYQISTLAQYLLSHLSKRRKNLLDLSW